MCENTVRHRQLRIGTEGTFFADDLTSYSAAMEGGNGYQNAIDEFVAWYCSEPRLALNKTVVLRDRFHLEERGLAPGAINVRMARAEEMRSIRDYILLHSLIADLARSTEDTGRRSWRSPRGRQTCQPTIRLGR